MRGTTETNRRDFIKAGTTVAAGAALIGGLNIARTAYAAGNDAMKMALIGCGGRGTGAAVNALSTKANVKLVAMADAFEDSLEGSLENIQKECKDRVDMSSDRKFTGLDAYQKAIDSGVDIVLLCTPPGFRPVQFEAAVKAGKHIFMEKPLATDAPGVRRIMAANAEAKQKKLAVAVGHHLRHETKYREIIQRIHDGAIGELKFLRAYFNTGGVWVRPRRPDQSEMQYQVHNWYYFTWLSGDHIVEQHVHDIDICNWIAKGHPVEAEGMGGRQVRIGKDLGEIFDHHAVEFTYADGVKLFSYCRQIPGCWADFSDHAHGTRARRHPTGNGRLALPVMLQDPGVGSRRRRPSSGNGRLTGGNCGRTVLQRGRLGRRKHHDRHPRPDGHLLGPGREMGRSGQLALDLSPEETWPGTPKRW